jgi:Lar family restriction alleviation protein
MIGFDYVKYCGDNSEMVIDFIGKMAGVRSVSGAHSHKDGARHVNYLGNDAVMYGVVIPHKGYVLEDFETGRPIPLAPEKESVSKIITEIVNEVKLDSKNIEAIYKKLLELGKLIADSAHPRRKSECESELAELKPCGCDFPTLSEVDASIDSKIKLHEKADEIKPCPFCGSEDLEARIIKAREAKKILGEPLHKNNIPMALYCNNCGARGCIEYCDNEFDEQSAIDLWNDRGQEKKTPNWWADAGITVEGLKNLQTAIRNYKDPVKCSDCAKCKYSNTCIIGTYVLKLFNGQNKENKCKT